MFQVQSSEVRLFADDRVLYIIIDSHVDSADALIDDFKRLTCWTDEGIVKFSPPKTKSLLITK